MQVKILVTIGFIILSLQSWAQSTSTTSTQLPQNQTSSNLNWTLGFKSYNATGRFGELNDSAQAPSKGRVYSGKQEVSAGFKLRNGWGSYFQFSQTRSEHNDPSLNKWSVSDPSISVTHPDLYKNENLRISGMFRAYIPYTTRSKTQNIRHFAYYSNLNYTMEDGSDLYNGVVVRFFPADYYKDTDTRFYFEDRTNYTRKISSNMRWGIGQWSQMEIHSKSETGYSIEAYPYFDYLFSTKTFIGPRVYLPVFVQNSVYEAPKSVSLNQARAEIYFQTSL